MSKERAIDALKSTLTSPEGVTPLFQSIWHHRQRALRKHGVDIDLTVVDCPYTQEQLAKLEKKGRRVGYLPESLSTQEQRHILSLLWPQMQCHSVQEGSIITNEVARHGWFDYEKSIDAPHANTTEDELDNLFRSQGRLGMNATEYIIASQDSMFLTGHYLDEAATYVRLLGSRFVGRVVSANFYSLGRLGVGSDLRSSGRNDRLGGRSVGFPPKI